MAVDTPARIAILGAGPIGLEAALYARFLGYDVSIYERDTVGANVLRWGHVKLFSPFAMNCSPLGLNALRAQNAEYQAPDDAALLTGSEFAQRYMIPLSKTDLLRDAIHEQTTVVAVGRHDWLKTDFANRNERCDDKFRLLLRDASGSERADEADVVIDATGTFGNHRWAGQGGIPAPGERAAADRIRYDLPDILGADREGFDGKRTMVVGAGYSAATAVVALAQLAEENPVTKAIWITRRRTAEGTGPIVRIENDRLAERDRIAHAANQLAVSPDGPISHLGGAHVSQISSLAGDSLEVTVDGAHNEHFSIDQMIANVGYHTDRALFAELQLHQCYVTDGPIKLAASLLGENSGDCLDQKSLGAESLLTSEPNFYILGSKSYGRDSRFLISIGLQQIRDLFTIIGDRADMNLYASADDLVHAASSDQK
jgi:thioredoxin reductase